MQKKQTTSEYMVIQNKELTCLNCGGKDFEEMKSLKLVQPESFIASLFTVHKKCRAYACRSCGLIQEFINLKK